MMSAVKEQETEKTTVIHVAAPPVVPPPVVVHPTKTKAMQPLEIEIDHRDDDDDDDDDERQKRRSRQRWCDVRDFTEPCFWVCSIYALVALVYTLVVAAMDYFIVTSALMATGSCLAVWRVRKLGLAQSFVNSVRALRRENATLHRETEKLASANQALEMHVAQLQVSVSDLDMANIALRSEVDRFERINGLLGTNARDIATAKTQLFALCQRYERENAKYQANNMLSLFNLVDDDNNGRLSREEVQRLREYVKAVFSFDLDIDEMDTDSDGSISLQEFVVGFQKTRERSTRALLASNLAL
jgi:cell division protein FtsB